MREFPKNLDFQNPSIWIFAYVYRVGSVANSNLALGAPNGFCTGTHAMFFLILLLTYMPLNTLAISRPQYKFFTMTIKTLKMQLFRIVCQMIHHQLPESESLNKMKRNFLNPSKKKEQDKHANRFYLMYYKILHICVIYCFILPCYHITLSLP